ncbi:hypothetical protein QJS10_CPA06g01500 [Acorus calamus]|uniref:CNH domain-containing protein n=1 Tax=Acorus calamus TaxID=4465 RepID=A0AAV9ELN6_ACOCL|nr:hypothetical protein QJS10_CPA06g01500 [Acorus calamus]
MDKPGFKDRTVLEPFAEFVPPSSLSIRSLAVSSVSDSQTLIYIGTDEGKLVLASGDPSQTSHSDQHVDFVRSVSITGFPVIAIDVLVDVGRVLALSDGSLFLLDPSLLQPVRKLSLLKGITAFAQRLRTDDDTASVNPLDVAPVSRSEASSRSGQRFLQRFGGLGTKANGVRPKDSFPQGQDGCFVAASAEKMLVLIEFALSDVDSSGILVNWGVMQGFDGVRSIAWLDDSIIVGTSDGYSLFSILTGQSVTLFSLPDSSTTPQLKTLYAHKEVLLLVDNVGVIVNAFGQPVGGSLVFRQAPDSIGAMSSYVVVVRDGEMGLYRKRTGACVQSITFAGNGEGPCILPNDEPGSGEVVVVSTPRKVICFRKVSCEEQIKYLLRKKNFKETVCLIQELEDEGELSKEMLSFVHAQLGFLLVFELHFEDAVNHFLQAETMQPSEVFPFIMRDPNRWSYLVPRNRYWGLHPPPVPLEQVVDDGLSAIQRAIFLRKAGVDTAVDEDFLFNPPTRADLLELAIQNMIRYLHLSRDKQLNSSVQEGVDTLLMYLYRALNLVDSMEKLASSQNSCVVEELESLLDESGHLRTLAFLYASKGMSSKALAIWRILARNYSTGLWNDQSAVESDSQDNSTNFIPGHCAAALEASKLLEESSDEDMVLHHLGWIADIDQELAVRVLTSEKRSNQLSPGKVLAAIDPKKVEVHQRYLQWLIEEQDSDDTRFHTLYALSLARSAIEIVEMEYSNLSMDDKRLVEMDFSVVVNGISYGSHVRERLQLFLQSSDLYDPQEVLDLIEGTELWLEKAILYRKLGQETLVLQILALKLEDSEAAEQYCAEIGRRDAYMQLLDMYLDPQNGKEPMFNAAVCLLHNHGESLDPLQVLEKLSPEMPLKLASDTILRMMRARVHHLCQGQIVRKLSGAVNLEARLARLEERSRHAQINDECVCDSCRARLGTKLFAMYPDDSVVCYKCYRRQGESTSSSGRNFKNDALLKPGWLVSRNS